MRASLGEVSRGSVLETVAYQLHVTDRGEGLWRALTAEHLRAVTYFGSTHPRPDGALALPHTTRLLTGVRKNLDGLLALHETNRSQGAEQSNIYRSVLDDLEAIGDLTQVGGGHWISTPLRLIDVGRNALLVVGGGPRDVVEAAVGAKVHCQGATRFVLLSDLRGRERAIPVQSADEWLGFSDPLVAWTERQLASHLAAMSPVESIPAEQLELYAPDIQRGRGKSNRWLLAADVREALRGPRLFRPSASAFTHPHYIGSFSYSDVLVLERSTHVSHETSQRLRFGLDATYRTPRSVRILTNGDHCLVDLWFPLPSPEARVLALGWQISPLPKQVVAIPKVALSVLERALERLAIVHTIPASGTR